MIVKKLFLRSRPLFWSIPLVLYGAGMIFAGYSWISFIQLILFTWPINYVIYATNDYYDEETDKNNPRKTSWIHGTPITKQEKQYMRPLVYSIIGFFLLTAAFVNTEHFIFACLAVLLGWAYNAPPLQLKNTVFASLLSGAGYFLCFILAYTVTSSVSAIPAYTYTLILPLIGIHVLSELIDSKADKRASRRTLGHLLGLRGSFLFLAALTTIPLITYWTDAVWAFALSFIILLALINAYAQKQEWLFATTAAYIGLLVCVAIIRVLQAIL